MNSLDQFVDDLVSATLIKNKKEKENLRKELFGHVYSQKKELELHGYSEEKILTTIQNNFGNIQIIGKELFFVHSMNKTRLIEIGIILFIILVVLILVFLGISYSIVTPAV